MSVISHAVTKYTHNIIFLLDNSGSMIDEPINQLNAAMTEAIPAAAEAVLKMESDLRLRAIAFNTTARWIIGNEAQGESEVSWIPLTAEGGTNTAAAIDLAKGVMHREYLGTRNYKPVVILITDGESNSPADTIRATNDLKNSLKSSTDPNKDKVIRIAIGVKGANRIELEQFASTGNIMREDGSIEENVPLVFMCEDIALLKNLIMGVTVSSLTSTNGKDEDSEDEILIIPHTEEKEEGWED